MTETKRTPIRVLAVDDEEGVLTAYHDALCPPRAQDSSQDAPLNSQVELSGGDPVMVDDLTAELTTCRQGDEAVEQVRQALQGGRPFAVAFIDLRMPPGPDGARTAELVRQIDPFVQIVIATGYSDHKAADISRRVPPRHRLLYVQKPLHLEEIRQFAGALGAKWQAEKVASRTEDDLRRLVQERSARLHAANQRLTQDIEDRRRITDRLRAREEQLRLFVQYTPAAIAMFDQDMQYLVASRKWLSDHRVEQTDIVGRDHYAACPQADPKWRAIHERCLAGEVQACGEDPTAQPDGSVEWFSWEAHPWQDALGLIRGSIIVSEITTDRKRVDDALRQSERKFHDIFHNAQVGIFRARLGEGVILEANRRASEMFGHASPESMLADQFSYRDHVSPDVIRQIGSQIRDTGEIRNMEAQFARKDGTRFWGRFSGRAYPQDGYFEGVITDVTDAREAIDALRESERRFREMADLLPDMVYEADSSLVVSYANQAVFDILGYTADDVAQNRYRLDMVVDDSETALEGLAKVARHRGTSVGRYRVKCRDGSSIPCEINSRAILDATGQVVGFRGVLRDISERVRAEEVQRLASVGQLAAGVAHEFNNILASIQGRAELAQMTGDKAAQDRLLETVWQATGRGAKITRNLLKFSRPSEPVREPTVLREPIDAALAMAVREIANAGVVVQRDYSARDACVLADAGQLEQVFLNLIINACHAMPDGGELRISIEGGPADSDQGQVVVSVADTGTGVSPPDLPHIFDPFFTTKGRLGQSELPGTGLGLSVSHGIITAHGGKIDVRSHVGVGTVFEIRLGKHALTARGASAARPERAYSPRPPAHTGHDRRVLVAEDEDSIREIIAELLAADGYEVVSVSSAGQACAALQQEPFDVVVSDLLMPEGGGRAVVAATKKLDSPPPVILVTGRGERSIVDEMLGMGVVAYLEKPVGLTELLRAVRGVVEPACEQIA